MRGAQRRARILRHPAGGRQRDQPALAGHRPAADRPVAIRYRPLWPRHGRPDDRRPARVARPDGQDAPGQGERSDRRGARAPRGACRPGHAGRRPHRPAGVRAVRASPCRTARRRRWRDRAELWRAGCQGDGVGRAPVARRGAAGRPDRCDAAARCRACRRHARRVEGGGGVCLSRPGRPARAAGLHGRRQRCGLGPGRRDRAHLAGRCAMDAGRRRRAGRRRGGVARAVPCRRPAGLCHLHLGIDRHTEGCRGQSRQPAALCARRLEAAEAGAPGHAVLAGLGGHGPGLHGLVRCAAERSRSVYRRRCAGRRPGCPGAVFRRPAGRLPEDRAVPPEGADGGRRSRAPAAARLSGAGRRGAGRGVRAPPRRVASRLPHRQPLRADRGHRRLPDPSGGRGRGGGRPGRADRPAAGQCARRRARPLSGPGGHRRRRRAGDRRCRCGGGLCGAPGSDGGTLRARSLRHRRQPSVPHRRSRPAAARRRRALSRPHRRSGQDPRLPGRAGRGGGVAEAPAGHRRRGRRGPPGTPRRRPAPARLWGGRGGGLRSRRPARGHGRQPAGRHGAGAHRHARRTAAPAQRQGRPPGAARTRRADRPAAGRGRPAARRGGGAARPAVGRGAGLSRAVHPRRLLRSGR